MPIPCGIRCHIYWTLSPVTALTSKAGLRQTFADLTKLTPQGFSFQEPRPKRREGGVGLFISSAHKFTVISLPTQATFESIYGKLEFGQSCLIILNIYHPLVLLLLSSASYKIYCPAYPHSPMILY